MSAEDKIERRDFLVTCLRGGLGALVAGGLGVGTLVGSQSAALAEVGNVAHHPARFWSKRTGSQIICELCPHFCVMNVGQRGECGARINQGGKCISLVYGKPVAIHGDPIEKAPFFHFLPGTKTLAVGTAGCNLHCKYCQNWEFTQALPETTDNKNLSPQSMVEQVQNNNIPSIIFTLNDPVQCLEYLLDTAQLSRPRGIFMLAHTSGFICPEPLKEMCGALDGIAVDLKGFTEDFYKTITGASLQPVLSTIKTIYDSGTWLELTHLVIPGYNDKPAMFREMCQWILDNVGPDVPLFVSRFFPKYQLRRLQATSPDTLRSLRKIAYEMGLRYVYLGNMPGDPTESTYCPCCGMKVIKRTGPLVTNTGLDPRTGKCVKCGLHIPGIWTA